MASAAFFSVSQRSLLVLFADRLVGQHDVADRDQLAVAEPLQGLNLDLSFLDPLVHVPAAEEENVFAH